MIDIFVREGATMGRNGGSDKRHGDGHGLDTMVYIDVEF